MPVGSRMRGALIGGIICFFAYVLVGFCIATRLGSEVISGAIFLIAITSPIPLVIGWICGALIRQERFGPWSLKLVGIGLLTPVLVFLTVLLTYGFQDSARAAESAAFRESEIAKTKELGFQFPPGAHSGIPGQLWSNDPIISIDAFYQAHSGTDWQRLEVGNHIWFLRFRRSAVDRVELVREYNTTSIYFGSLDQNEFKCAASAAFLSGIQAGDWKLVRRFSDLPPAALKAKFKDVRVTSSTFSRDSFIGANAKREIRDGYFQSGEVLLKLSNDEIPKVLEVRLPEGW
jgi:hypothetical protein